QARFRLREFLPSPVMDLPILARKVREAMQEHVVVQLRNRKRHVAEGTVAAVKRCRLRIAVPAALQEIERLLPIRVLRLRPLRETPRPILVFDLVHSPLPSRGPLVYLSTWTDRKPGAEAPGKFG